MIGELFNETQAGFQHANHAVEQQPFFSLELKNLVLAYLSDKVVTDQIISSDKHWQTTAKI